VEKAHHNEDALRTHQSKVMRTKRHHLNAKRKNARIVTSSQDTIGGSLQEISSGVWSEMTVEATTTESKSGIYQNPVKKEQLV